MRHVERRGEGDLIDSPSSASTIRSALIETVWSRLPALQEETYHIFHYNLPQNDKNLLSPHICLPSPVWTMIETEPLVGLSREKHRGNVKETFSTPGPFSLWMLMFFNEDMNRELK